MSYHESIKPVLATAFLALYLPVPFYLVWLHGLLRLWRRLGSAAYVFLLTPYAAMVLAIIHWHTVWQWRAWPWPHVLPWLAPVPLAAGGWLAVYTYRTIEPRTLHLERQINPGAERALITTGVLGRMRHPRYVMFTMIALGNVLLTGYPLVVVSCGATMVLLWVTIRLEERELLEYFGEAFRDYRKSVPAFIPRPSRGGRDAVS